MLFDTPNIGEQEADVIDEIEKLKQSLGYLVAVTPKRWTGVLRRNALARAVRGSNSIEGYVMSVDDAIAVAEGEEPLDASDATRAAVEGYQDAMTYVLQLASDPHFSYSAALIRSLHFMMIKHDLPKIRDAGGPARSSCATTTNVSPSTRVPTQTWFHPSSTYSSES